ncbi:hypothetical protein ACF7HK_15665, partial [Staphylococcus aureus]
YVMEQPSPCTTTIEPVTSTLGAATTGAHSPQQEKPLQREACTLQLEGSPHSPQPGKVLISNKNLAQPKIKKERKQL